MKDQEYIHVRLPKEYALNPTIQNVTSRCIFKTDTVEISLPPGEWKVLGYGVDSGTILLCNLTVRSLKFLE